MRFLSVVTHFYLKVLLQSAGFKATSIMAANGFQHSGVTLCIVSSLLLLLTPGTRLQDISTIKAFCEVHQSVIVDVDPGQHRYYPFMVRLPRCAGSVSLSKPNVKKCVASASFQRSYSVYTFPNFNPVTVKLDHHTRCKGECVKSSNSCNNFEVWDGDSCQCNCKYTVAPSPSPCNLPLVWRQSKCSCVCPSEAKKCPNEKEWNNETCMCSCKKRYLNRCSKKNKLVNHENCKCMDLPPPNATAAARGSTMQCDGVQSKYVAVIVVIEFLVLTFVFVVIYRCKSNGNTNGNDRDDSNNTKPEESECNCLPQVDRGSKDVLICFPKQRNGNVRVDNCYEQQSVDRAVSYDFNDENDEELNATFNESLSGLRVSTTNSSLASKSQGTTVTKV